MRTSAVRAHFSAFVVVVLALACAQSLTPSQVATITRWLECGECTDGELDSVLVVGQSAVDFLETALLAGPDSTRLANLRAQFHESYASMAQYAAAQPGSSINATEPEYIDHFLGNHVAMWRIRAAIALAHLGGPDAASALNGAADSATAGTYRQDVNRWILVARDSILGSGPP